MPAKTAPARDAASPRARTLAHAAASAAAEKKGEDIVLLSVRRQSPLADYLLIVSANSPAHLEALAERIEESLEARGHFLAHRDGRRSESWRVLDYGSVMVHLMRPETRELYGLERLYRGARKLRLKDG